MYYRKSEEITERAEIHTITEEAEILLYVTIFIHVLPQKRRNYRTCQNSYNYRRSGDITLCTYIHRSKHITERVTTYKFAVEKTKISPRVPIFKHNNIESLDVPMFYIRIVQVKRRSITTHAYTPKDSLEPLDVPIFHIRNVQVK